MAAYAFAWMRFRGVGVLFIIIFALQIIPLQMALVPLLQIFSTVLRPMQAWLHDVIPIIPEQNYLPLWIAHSMFALPLAIFLLHNFISEIPADVIEAARVDGATHGQIFFRIVLPLAVPALASFAIFQFIWVWNDLLVALIFSGGTQDVAPLTQRLAELTGTRGQDWQLLTAAAFISIVDPADRVLQPAALLRARSAGGLHEGVGTGPPHGQTGRGNGCRERGARGIRMQPMALPVTRRGRTGCMAPRRWYSGRCCGTSMRRRPASGWRREPTAG